MYLILITGVDSGYCPVPCGIPQGSRISESERAWEFPDSGISGSGKQVTSKEDDISEWERDLQDL